jgi:hypothetical protein
MNNEKHYGCPGGCGAEITEDQFQAGQTTCQDESCERCGEPFEEMQYCPGCDVYYTAENATAHSECG